MKCPYCSMEMLIDHTAYTASGDNSPDTPTEIFNLPYFICRNPKCQVEGQLIEGNKIRLETPKTRIALQGAEYCCDEILCIITPNTFKVSARADAGAKLNTDNMELTVPCPKCAKVHQFDVRGRTNATS